MIRPAKFYDIVRIIELLDEMHEKSRYASRVAIDYKVAHKLFAQCIQRHGGTNDGSSLVMVAVRDQKVEGFFVGMLDRVYHVGTKLRANDIYLYNSPRSHAPDMIRLFDAYLSWASSNPRVIEIMASWTDTIEGAQRIESLYEMRDFRPSGGIWTRDVAHQDVSRIAVLEGVE